MGLPEESIVFILARTQFASNLGQAARVMKNMGFSRLLLVRPQCEVGMEARTRAMKGAEILDRAELFPSLEAAAREVDLLVGSSGRFGPGKPNWITSRRFAEAVVGRYLPARVGIAFGAEDTGLEREEVALCQWLIEIPTGSQYGVLNLAQAVGILAYDLHLALADTPRRPTLHRSDPQHVAALLEDVRATLQSLGFPTRVPLERVMKRFQKIAGRAQLEIEDVNLFRGLLRHLRRAGRKN